MTSKIGLKIDELDRTIYEIETAILALQLEYDRADIRPRSLEGSATLDELTRTIWRMQDKLSGLKYDRNALVDLLFR